MRGWSSLTIVAAMVASVPALAGPSSSKKGDPNEVVCQKVESIGSRVATKKVCATRAEWEEKRKLDRDAIDQAQRGANGPCQTVNTHSGAASC